MRNKSEFHIAFTTDDPKNIKLNLSSDVIRAVTEGAISAMGAKRADTLYVKIISADEKKLLVVNDVEGMYEDNKLTDNAYMAKVTVYTEVEIIDN